jgi:hypothetical protein
MNFCAEKQEERNGVFVLKKRRNGMVSFIETQAKSELPF